MNQRVIDALGQIGNYVSGSESRIDRADDGRRYRVNLLGDRIHSCAQPFEETVAGLPYVAQSAIDERRRLGKDGLRDIGDGIGEHRRQDGDGLIGQVGYVTE